MYILYIAVRAVAYDSLCEFTQFAMVKNLLDVI